MRKILVFAVVILFLLTSCGNSGSGKVKNLIIFHAGSLSVPFKELKSEYEKKHPDINILLEPSGSIVCARKVTELKKPCDIVASADYFVINELLIPDYASWNIRFATNEIVIAYSPKAHYSSEINENNWMDILSRDDVIYGRSDPNSDPCGYRTVLTFKLAEKYYNIAGLADKLESKNKDYIRPKEVDLVALAESNSIDYMFQYKSVAIQHGFKYLELPKEINLSDPAMQSLYQSVSIDVTGSKPGSIMNIKGDYINYSVTVLNKAPQKDAAIDFLCFMLSDEGMNIFRENGQNPIIPFKSEQEAKLPSKILQYLKKN